MAHAGSTQNLTKWNINWWRSILLGLVLVLAGLFILRNAVAATLASAIVFGIALLATGVFEIVHAFWAQRWGGPEQNAGQRGQNGTDDQTVRTGSAPRPRSVCPDWMSAFEGIAAALPIQQGGLSH